MKASIALVGALLIGCASKTSDPAAASTEDITSLSIDLPATDTCRNVLAPIALGLASRTGGAPATHVTVSLLFQTDARDYVFEVGNGSTSVRYGVELDNDNSFKCGLLGAWINSPSLPLENEARSPATAAELDPNPPVVVAPADDSCASTVSALARAAAIAAARGSAVEQVDVTADGKSYHAHVDGQPRVVYDAPFSNDWDFLFKLDAACRVQRITGQATPK
jgi:hypothetical protein